MSQNAQQQLLIELTALQQRWKAYAPARERRCGLKLRHSRTRQSQIRMSAGFLMVALLAGCGPSGPTDAERMELSRKCAILSKELEKREYGPVSGYYEMVVKTHYSFRDKRCYAETSSYFVTPGEVEGETIFTRAEKIYDGVDKQLLAGFQKSTDAYSNIKTTSALVPSGGQTESEYRKYSVDVMSAP